MKQLFICNSCKDVRSELPERYEHLGGFQSGPQGFYYEDDRCDCGGTYVDAVECVDCGERVSETNNEGLCAECYGQGDN